MRQFYTFTRFAKTGRFSSTTSLGYSTEGWNSNGFCGRALGSICDDSLTLSQALQLFTGNRLQTCEFVVKFAAYEAEVCDSFSLLRALQKGDDSNPPQSGGTVRNGGIQTAFAGGLWGAYLRTAYTFASLAYLRRQEASKVRNCGQVWGLRG